MRPGEPPEVEQIQVQGVAPGSWQPHWQYEPGDVGIEHSPAGKALGVLVDGSWA